MCVGGAGILGLSVCEDDGGDQQCWIEMSISEKRIERKRHGSLYKVIRFTISLMNECNMQYDVGGDEDAVFDVVFWMIV